MAKIQYSPADNKTRCEWCLKDDLYVKYHDDEWGNPSHDDQHLFEHLILETFQAGLSWHTILKKREAFRDAFYHFNAEKMMAMKENEILELLQNKNIIRSRAKIEAAINNARRFMEIKDEFGSFATYIWSFTNHKTLFFYPEQMSEVVTTTPESDAMAKDLKFRGFKFVGSTTCMAYMEAVGMIDHHLVHCFRKENK